MQSQKWAYRTVRVGRNEFEKRVESTPAGIQTLPVLDTVLNDEGRDGWELVGFHVELVWTTMVFKKPASD